MKKYINKLFYIILCMIIITIIFSLTIEYNDRNSSFSLRNQPPNIESLFSSIFTIHTKGTIFVEGNNRPYEIFGTGVHIGEGYILTLTHCSQFPEIITHKTPFGKVMIPSKTIEENCYINGEKLQLIGREGEISLFRMKNPPLMFLSLSNDEEIKMGKEVVLFCNAFGEYPGIRITNIYSNNTKVSKMYNIDDGDILEHSFSLNTIVIHGSSGSPVIIYTYNNQPKILGIIQSFLPGSQLTVAIKPSHIKDGIQKIKENNLDQFNEKRIDVK
jgi:hypothetical protein